MIQVNGDKFIGASISMRALVERFSKMSGPFHPAVTAESIESLKTSLRGYLSSITDAYSKAGLTSAVAQVERIEHYIDSDDLKLPEIASMLRELQNRMVDQMQSMVFLIVPAHEKEHYLGVDLFGGAVSAKFADANFDIAEAGKCLALDRGTACVMHLMRVIELAVDAIALGVGVHKGAVEAATTWEHLLKEVNTKIQDANKTKIPSWVAAQSFFENAYVYLLAVKNAWRNPSMHLDKKYTEEEAARIYAAVKHLMEHLAEHLDQSGTFTP